MIMVRQVTRIRVSLGTGVVLRDGGGNLDRHVVTAIAHLHGYDLTIVLLEHIYGQLSTIMPT